MDTQNNNTSQNSSGAPSQSNPTATAPKVANSKNTVMGILSYLGILLIIPFLMEKNNSFVKYHLKQGIVLLAIEIVVWIIGMTSIMYGFSMILSLVNLATLVLSIIGIVNVVQGKEKEIPVVGQFSKFVKF